MSQRAAVDELETRLRELGRLDSPVDEMRLAVARGLAEQVDAAEATAAMWKEFRAAVEVLMGDGSDDDDGLDAELADLSPKVGDPPAS